MSNTTDWLSAAGGLVGAIGGPAGIWAAWNQHKQEKRRRQAPPTEVRDVLVSLNSILGEAVQSYRPREWWQKPEVYDVCKRLRDLGPVITDPLLQQAMSSADSYITMARTRTTHAEMQPEEVATNVRKQAENAKIAHQKVGSALARYKQLA